MAYLTVAQFRLRTIMPQADVDELEVSEPGFLDAQLSSWSSRIDARLRKRYAVPLRTPVPEVILAWLTQLVTPRAYLKRGVNPSDAQFSEVIEDAKAARDEIKEAADSEKGLYDLPLIEGAASSGVTSGGPLSYSEQSPYVWAQYQRQDAEDFR